MVTLVQKLNERKARIGIVGLGYVGLPLCLAYAEKGYQVVGFDIDETKVSAIKNSKSYIHHIPSSRIKKVQCDGVLDVTTNFELASEVDALILCVPTPLNKYREPDLSYIRETMDTLLPYLRRGQIISLESTTYPGTTEEELIPRIEQKNLVIGGDIFLIYSPEREDPGNVVFTTTTIPKILGGVTQSCTEAGIALYGKVIDKVVPMSSTKAAEMTKLVENIHRAVNIGLMNELKPLADKMGIDLYEVIRAASTKPFGFVPYYPGPGLGGHCIPIDPFYLTWKAREYGMHTRFIELAGEINTSMPSYVVDKTADALNRVGKPIKNCKILILGIAYKKNVDDMRESPSVEIMHILISKGANVSYCDPYFPKFPNIRKYSFTLRSTMLTPEAIAGFDAVILAADHDSFDYSLIKQYSQLIIDTRGRFQPAINIIRA